MAGDEKNVGGVGIDDGQDPLAPLTHATKNATRQALDYAAMVNAELIRLDAAALPITQSQHEKIRVRFLVVNISAAGGTISLQIGTVQYPFTLTSGTGLEVIPFPLLIERGTDMAAVGAAGGRIYVIGDPE